MYLPIALPTRRQLIPYLHYHHPLALKQRLLRLVPHLLSFLGRMVLSRYRHFASHRLALLLVSLW